MTPDFIQLAKKQKRKIVLPESDDSRILEAAVYCDQNNIAEVVLLGDSKVIQQQLSKQKLSIGNIQIINPQKHKDLNRFAKTLIEVCPRKKLNTDQAYTLSQQPLYFANLLVRDAQVDACVAGINHTSGDVIRAALNVVSMQKEKSRPSSFFIIISNIFQNPVIFADCAMNISPNAKQLVDIAYQSSKSIQSLLNQKPKIAMLSFSTNGSAIHRDVTKVRNATKLLKEQHPELEVIGEIQFDAAISKDIFQKKWPESSFEPPANIFIFPTLDAANIAYKIAEQIGQATAIGPLLQGLAKPVNDLSRGATVESIVNTIAVTCLQAIDR
ncbi:MAG: phosphate acetyltransferase [Cocleimonas sp.]